MRGLNVRSRQVFGRLFGSGRPSKAADRSVLVFGPTADRPLLGNGAQCRTHPLHHFASTRLHELLRPHVIQALGDALLAAQLGNGDDMHHAGGMMHGRRRHRAGRPA